MPRGAPPVSRTAQCQVCGAAARRSRGPAVSPRAWGRPLPDVAVALCESCHGRTWRRSVGLVAVAVAVVAASLGAARATFVAWPWVPWPVLVLATVLGGGLAWLIGARWMARSSSATRDTGWNGVPVRVVRSRSEGWTLHVASVRALSVLRDDCDEPASKRVVENDAVVPALGLALGVLVAGGVLWFAWHPEVRVLNVTDTPLAVVVDGRQMAWMAGVPGESPNAGLDIRVPEGWRVWRAVRPDGTEEDETRAWVGRGASRLYAPGCEGRCFWVERRAYGRARSPRPRVVELPSDRCFFSVPRKIDAWFQPNPQTPRDLWFSGGVRRALRMGACAGGAERVDDEATKR